ncbi:unnamed protein product [Rhizophagus irregularis]|nr:unnamed protein product [Rhizophagus irregularis]
MNIPPPNETESPNNAPLLNDDETDSKTAKKTSWVWTYWDEETQEIKGVSRQVIICKVIDASNQTPCRKIYIKSSGSTGNAINHLRNKHDITKDGKNNKPKDPDNQVTKSHKHYSAKNQEESRQYLVDWIVDDIQPISVVANLKFRQLINQLNPTFVMPCPETVKGIIHDAFNFSFPKLQQTIRDQAKSVSLTLDLWTAKNRQGFLGITCSFINNSFELHEYTLDIAYVRYPHTSQHILETLEEVLKEWKIRELQSERLEDIQKKFPDLNNDLRKENINPEKTSEYLLHVISDSPTRWNSSYLAWQRLLKLKNHIIMLINTLATKNDLDSKKDYKRLNSIMLTSDEWDLIQDLIPVLKPYAEATELLGGSSYCTHSMMNPILINIKKRFHPSTSRGVAAAEKININFGDNDTAFDEDMAIEENEQLQAGIEDNERQLLTNNKRTQINNPVNCYGLIDQIKLSLFTAMNYYWNDLTSPDKLLPTLLDPRMKDLSFVSDSERYAAKDLLEKKYKELKFQGSNDDLLLPINVDDNRKKNKKAYTIFADLKKKIIPADDEIGNYLQLEEIDLEDSIHGESSQES